MSDKKGARFNVVEGSKSPLLLDRIKIYEGAIQNWAGVIGPTAWMLFSYILNKSVAGWGDLEIDVSDTQLINGHQYRGTYLAPISLSRETLGKARKTLDAHGLVTSKFNGRSIIYRVNVKQVLSMSPKLPLAKRMRQDSLRKHQNQISENREAPSGFSDTLTSIASTNHSPPTPVAHASGGSVRIRSRSRGEEISPVQRQQNALADLISETEKKSDAKIAERVAQAKAKPGAVGAFEVWMAAIRETHGEKVAVAVFSVAESKSLNTLANRFTAETGSFKEFLEFAAREWSGLMRNQFSWMKGPRPDYPRISFVIRFADHFIDAWSAFRAAPAVDQPKRDDGLLTIEEF
jgi:hypothetical protein